MIKNNIRGGISSIMGNREIEAHNYKILQECFDIKEDENLLY